jgi:hypothetical protein
LSDEVAVLVVRAREEESSDLAHVFTLHSGSLDGEGTATSYASSVV